MSDGLMSICKACNITKVAAWQRAHATPSPPKPSAEERRAHHKTVAAEYRRRNAERIRAYNHAYRQRTKDHILQYNVAYRAKNRPKWRAYSADQQQLRRGVGDFISRFAVYDTHNGICGICDLPVSRDAFQVDHIVPIKRGGKHIVANLQPAHARCNRMKHDRIGFKIIGGGSDALQSAARGEGGKLPSLGTLEQVGAPMAAEKKP